VSELAALSKGKEQAQRYTRELNEELAKPD